VAALCLSAAARGGDAGGERPLALAAGDFDGDGVPDLVVAARTGSGGAVALRRGRPGARSPIEFPGSTRRGRSLASSFGPAESGVELPLAPDLLGVGDFDGDGRLDVVATALGGDSLAWLVGDGRGGLALRRRIALPGAVTALVAGEINRPDGLADLVVGVLGAGGPQALVHEWPTGAMHARPEVIALPAPASALALGPLDDVYGTDLAVAAGREILIVQGRDRRLSAHGPTRGTVPSPVVVERVALRDPPQALVAGDFGGDWRPDLAVLSADGSVRLVERAAAGEAHAVAADSASTSRATWRESETIGSGEPAGPRPRAGGPVLARARVASTPKDAVVVLDPPRRLLQILTAAGSGLGEGPGVVAHALDGVPVAVLPVLVDADALSDLVVLGEGRDEVTVLASPVTRTFVITSTGDQSDPNLGGPSDDGLCDVELATPGEQCTLRAALEIALATTRDAAFTFDLGTESEIRVGSRLPSLLGVVSIDGRLTGAISRVTLDGSGAGAGANGLEVRGANSTVRNLHVTGFPGHGLLISGTPPPGGGGHLVEGCAFESNGGHGVFIEGGTPGNTISGNEIVLNSGDGVHIGSPARPEVPGGGNVVAGNPSIARNGGHGVVGNDTPSNTIDRNNISENGRNGLHLAGQGASGNLVTGNSVGTAGSNGGDAVVNDNAPQTTIGGSAGGQGNTLAGDNNGVRLEGGLLSGIRITGNFLKEDQTGATFDVGILGIKSGRLLTVEANVFEKLDADGTSFKAQLDASTIYNFRQNRFEVPVKLGTDLTLDEGLTVELDYSGNVHADNEKALRLVESIGELRFTSSNLQVNGGTGTEIVIKARGERNLEGWRVTGGGGMKLVADLGADVRTTVRAEGMLIADSDQDALSATFSGQGDLGLALINTQVQGAKGDGFRFDVFAGVGAQVDVDLADVQMSGLKATGSAGLRFSNRSASIDVFRAEVSTSDFDDFDFNFFFFNIQLGNTIAGSRVAGGSVGVLLDGGTQATISGTTVSGNSVAGIVVQGGSGGTLSGSTVTGNGAGIVVTGGGPGMALGGSSIFGNAGLGIDLGGDGVTPNDPGDGDTGPNGLQNYPVLASVTAGGGSTRIAGSLDSVAGADFTLAFYANAACDASGFGEGEMLLGTTQVTTDGGGRASFDATFAGTAAAGAATATDAAGNTSEFSACVRSGPAGTPREQLVALIAEVQSLGLPDNLETSLLATLNAALASIDRGDDGDAVQQLRAFIHQVMAWSGRGIGPQPADGLVSAAQQIIVGLGRAAPPRGTPGRRDSPRLRPGSGFPGSSGTGPSGHGPP
jgi:parallel beta-helix repeat protein